MFGMSLGMEMAPQQQLKASPNLIALNAMLVLSSHELQQLVQRELEENPAIEQIEQAEARCAACHQILVQGVCVFCLRSNARLSDGSDAEPAMPDQETDPLLTVAAPLSHCEMLQRDLRAALPASDYSIIDYLLGSLDEHGFLQSTTAEIAQALGVAQERVDTVRAKLHELGTPGLGAQSLQESLLLQLDQLPPEAQPDPLLRVVLADHWPAFGEHRYSEIARALGVSYDHVLALRGFVREHLRPFPLQGGAAGDAPALMPDLVITAEEQGFSVEVVESRRFALRLNPLYQQLARALSQGQADISADEALHLSTYVSRARLFLSHLRQRQATMQRIAETIVVRQEAFLRYGMQCLAPLTRAEVAAEVGVHESTVSRATAHKYAQLPSRVVIPVSDFFRASLPVKTVLREIIAQEQTPLTDEELGERLRERGFPLARRTVAKYRAQLGIPPSSIR
jgi:RNA polymerase sigma-54 factor